MDGEGENVLRGEGVLGKKTGLISVEKILLLCYAVCI